MKKFLLVVMIGMVLAMDLYGIVKEIINNDIKEENVIEKTSTIVYVE